MDRAHLLALVSETLDGMREDLSLKRAGRIKCRAFRADVTPEMITRVEKRASKLEAVASALAQQDA